MGDAQDLRPGFWQELILQQLTDVFLVNVFPLGLGWHNETDSRPLELLRIEAGAHGESGSEQARALQAKRFGMVRCGADDAQKRDRGSALDFVEYEVRRVRSDESEVGAGVDELIQGCGDVIG